MFESIAATLTIVAVYWIFLSWHRVSRDWRPAELKAGRVVMIEKDLRMNRPYPVTGRPDQVYQLANGLHVPVEGKNRDTYHVYDTDIAQLSLQAWLLRHNGMPTAKHGFVAINHRQTGKRRAIKVRLMDDECCSNLVERYLDVIECRVLPEKKFGPKCKACGHQMIC